jgi:hypothetical protein
MQYYELAPYHSSSPLGYRVLGIWKSDSFPHSELAVVPFVCIIPRLFRPNYIIPTPNITELLKQELCEQ